jgi:ribonucleoside-diphosphate reductase beta chain
VKDNNNNAGLLGTRTYYKPFDYPWAFEYYKAQQDAHWGTNEVPLHEDIKDWARAGEEERNLITQLFRFFTQGDVDVAAGYYDKFIPLFRKPELRMMMGAFANMESVHQEAYALLLDTIGMPEVEYQAFAEYEEMAAKHEYVNNFNPQNMWTKSYDPNSFIDKNKEIAKALAVYPAFTEGLQLFSSFAILLNFSRFGKYKGMSQIVTWSVRDESLHVEGMLQVFRTFIQENQGVWTDEFKKEIYTIAREMVDLEDRFIDLVFELGGVQGLEADEVKQYIRYIGDRRLLQLGLKPNWGIKDNPLPWLDEILNGIEHSNFFETRVTEYSKSPLLGSWSEVWE